MSTKFSGTPEGEIIKLLAAIQNSLNSTGITRRDVKPEAGSASAKAIKTEVNKVLKPLVTTLEQTNEHMKGLRDNTRYLNRHIETSRVRFSGLNLELGKLLKTLTNYQISPKQFDDSIFTAASDVGSSLVDIKKSVGSLNRAIDKTRQKFDDVNGSLTNMLDTLKLASISDYKNDDPMSAGFNTNDVVRAIVDTKHVIQQWVKAYTEVSTKNANSIIDAINNSAMAHANYARQNQDSQNSIIQQSNQILQQSASTQPVATEQTVTQQNTAPQLDATAQNTQTEAVEATTAAQQAAATGANNLAGAANNAATNQNAGAAATGKNNKAILSNSQMLSKYLMHKAREIRTVELASSALGNFKEAILAATKQFFALAEMGMGSLGNMLDLNVAAIKSGMSVKDYTEMFVKNMEFAARAGSIDNFDAITSANNGMLARMGVFGQSAKELQVAMAQTATEMGISQKDIPDTSEKLIKVFGRLNKTVSMTSKEFMESIVAIRDNTQFQNEAAGLNDRERQARLVQMTEMYSFGRTLGLSADEASKLGKAMLDQRRMTVKDRFKESGKLMQLASVTGNAGMIPELQSLMLKGRARTTEDEARLTSLMGKLEVDSQRMMEGAAQGGQLGIQNNLEMIKDGLSAETVARMQGKAKADTADKSAALGQSAFGQEVGLFGTMVDKFGVIIQGMRANEILSPLLTAIAGGLAFVFGKQIVAGLVGAAKLVRRAGRPTPATPTGGVPPSAGTPITQRLKDLFGKTADAVKNGAGKLQEAFKGLTSGTATGTSRFSNFLSSAGNAIKNGAAKTGSLLSSAASSAGNAISSLASKSGKLISSAASSTASAASSAASKMGSALKVVATGIKGIPLIGTLVTAGLELFTGNLRSAFSPDGGFMNGLASAILAIPYSLGDMLVSGLEFIFGENLLKPVRTALDVMGAGIMYGVNTLVAWLAKGLSWFTDILPDDSKLKKTVDAWSASTAKVADDTKKTLDRTINGETLSAISQENKQKMQPAQTAEPERAAPRRLSEASKRESENTNPGQKEQTKEDPVLTVLNSMLTVLTQIRDQPKIEVPDLKPTVSSLENLIPGFGNTAEAQRRGLGFS